MNRKLSLCLIGAVSLAGCGQPTVPDANSGYVMNEQTAESAESVAGTLVNLKVPNMH